MMFKEKRDFFFGNVKDKECSLSKLLDLAERVPANYFNQQLNRLLTETGGELVITDETSMPSFERFLSKLSLNDIGKIEIESRIDINNSVDATLACSIWLPKGVCHLRPHWCAYKPMRAREIISTLLVPLHLSGLEKRTYISLGGYEFEPLVDHDDFYTELQAIFRVSKYTIDGDALNEYVEMIQRATNAFKNSGDYHEACKLYS